MEDIQHFLLSVVTIWLSIIQNKQALFGGGATNATRRKMA